MSRFETWLKTDLMQPNQVVPLHGRLFSQDAMSNLIGVHVFSDGEPVESLNGTVTGWVIRADGATVAIDGETSGNDAYIILPQAAYAVVGNITIAIRLVDTSGEDTVETTLGVCTGYVYRTTTDTIVDPGEVVPDLAELLAAIEAMEEATSDAVEAAEAAQAAAATIGTVELIQGDDYKIIITSGEE